MSRKPKPFLPNVAIEAVAAEGNSLAHVNGKVLFVSGTMPGDIVDVQVNKVRKGYMEGYVVKMIQPSADRIAPFCRHFGVCGGCSWQFLPYPQQLAFKRQQVEDQLIRIGHLQVPEVLPTLGSERTTEYRNKLEFTFSRRRWVLTGEDPEALSDEQRLGLGFHVAGFFDKVLDIEHCHLQAEPSNTIRLFIKQYAIQHGLSFFDLREQKGFLRNLTVRTTSTGEVMLLVAFGPEALEKGAKKRMMDLLDAIQARFPEITSLYYAINPKCNDALGDLPCTLYAGNEAVYEQMENLRFKIGPKSFYQTNSAQAYRLYSVVRDRVRNACLQLYNNGAGEACKPVVYDLYTGTGTIALFLSALAEKVVGIEYVPEAIEDAKVNAAVNGITHAEFVAGDMKDILTADFIAAHGQPDIVVLDPPRAGIHPDVAQVLLTAAPKHMVYVSCNPATQARDLALFAPEYEIDFVQPVDMFPHTTHVENVVSLHRK
ncbi:MAG: 23S rRNA (uracil(1939)-C(5))-methyltransferase RlmD [Bacteroidales bacterium]|nr:23S rRNA (uracil(1939)-C(5))-methyltransferase RlmD [Bacteroidales bacterium]